MSLGKLIERGGIETDSRVEEVDTRVTAGIEQDATGDDGAKLVDAAAASTSARDRLLREPVVHLAVVPDVGQRVDMSAAVA